MIFYICTRRFFRYTRSILLSYPAFYSKGWTRTNDLGLINALTVKKLQKPPYLAGVDGFEPSDAGVKVLCLTTWRHPNIKTLLTYFAPCACRHARFTICDKELIHIL